MVAVQTEMATTTDRAVLIGAVLESEPTQSLRSLRHLLTIAGVCLVAVGALELPAGADKSAEQMSHLLRTIGNCVAGEPGLGSIFQTYSNLPAGQYSTSYTVTGPESATFSSSFTISATAATALVIWSDLLPGTYSLYESLNGVSDSPNGNGPGAVTVPDCLANGEAAPITAPIDSIAVSPGGLGYSILGVDGHVYSEGNAQTDANDYPALLDAPMVGMAVTPDGQGAWLVDSKGDVFTSGDATYHCSVACSLAPGQQLSKPIVGMAATADGMGYWEVASDGGIFAFGDAQFHGSTGSIALNQPIVGMAPDYATGGYWLVAADGGVFAFDAPFYGSTGSIRLNKPIVGMEAAPDGSGYRFVATDGGVFCFGLPFSGSMGSTHLNQPVVGMAADGTSGYWLVAADGGLFTFGGAPFLGTPA